MKTTPRSVTVVLLGIVIALTLLKRPMLSIVVDSAIIGGLIVGGFWGLRGTVGGAIASGLIAGLIALKFT